MTKLIKKVFWGPPNRVYRGTTVLETDPICKFHYTFLPWLFITSTLDLNNRLPQSDRRNPRWFGSHFKVRNVRYASNETRTYICRLEKNKICFSASGLNAAVFLTIVSFASVHIVHCFVCVRIYYECLRLFRKQSYNCYLN